MSNSNMPTYRDILDQARALGEQVEEGVTTCHFPNCRRSFDTAEERRQHMARYHALYTADDPLAKTIGRGHLLQCTIASLRIQWLRDHKYANQLKDELVAAEKKHFVDRGLNVQLACFLHKTEDAHRYYDVSNQVLYRLTAKDIIPQIIAVRKVLYHGEGGATLQGDIDRVCRGDVIQLSLKTTENK